jgi:magnesium-transporting ATPase (P-type)
MASRGSGSAPSGKSWWLVLLIIPFIAVLFPQFYDSANPTFAGMPYFYWYQLLWIILSGVVTGIVFLVTR